MKRSCIEILFIS